MTSGLLRKEFFTDADSSFGQYFKSFDVSSQAFSAEPIISNWALASVQRLLKLFKMLVRLDFCQQPYL